MTEGKRRLLELEKTRKYVFHGTGKDVEVFEPRQSHNSLPGKKIKDGEPAISASPDIDYAIFMAIFSRKNCPKGFTAACHFEAEAEDAQVYKLIFKATKESISQLNDESCGWVYVFNKEDFPFEKSQTEYRSHVPVMPLERVLVKKEDLPEVKELNVAEVILPIQE